MRPYASLASLLSRSWDSVDTWDGASGTKGGTTTSRVRGSRRKPDIDSLAHAWTMVQEEDKQNVELLDLSRQILTLTKEVRALAGPDGGATFGPSKKPAE